MEGAGFDLEVEKTGDAELRGHPGPECAWATALGGNSPSLELPGHHILTVVNMFVSRALEGCTDEAPARRGFSRASRSGIWALGAAGCK